MTISRTTERYRLHRDGARALFNDVCTRCGYDKHWEVLEFHHIIPRKISGRLELSNMWNHKWATVRNEVLEHCTLLCPTCHKEVHLEMDRDEDSIRHRSQRTTTNESVVYSSEGC